MLNILFGKKPKKDKTSAVELSPLPKTTPKAGTQARVQHNAKVFRHVIEKHELAHFFPDKPTKIEKHLVHDNGGRPFMVKVMPSTKSFQIFKQKPVKPEYDENNNSYDVKIMDEKYQRVFIGDDKFTKYFSITVVGNSFLFHLQKNEYVYVGSSIYKFFIDMDDEIIGYHSYVGNNDVPYPYAISRRNVYLMIENVYFSLKDMLGVDTKTPLKEPYMFYYDLDRKTREKIGKNMTIKTIHKRLW
jgi:hypothetical protein